MLEKYKKWLDDMRDNSVEYWKAGHELLKEEIEWRDMRIKELEAALRDTKQRLYDSCKWDHRITNYCDTCGWVRPSDTSNESRGVNDE